MPEEFGPHEAGGQERDAESVSVLPALAEVHRRAGRAGEAEQVARRALEFEPGRADIRVVLALALLDEGRADEVRQVLEPLATALLARHGLDESDTPPQGPAEEVSDAEFEEAFETARPEREHMVDADAVAQQAIRAADRELGRELTGGQATPFATRTVAELLESQGNPESARQIRAAIDVAADPLDPGRQRLIEELERWLENLRRPRS